MARPNSREDDRFRAYEALLAEFGPPLGLISPADVSNLWERHIQDSLRGLGCLLGTDRLVLDVGSGAGLPGIPLALASPGRNFLLLEASHRRAGFLELAVERLGLSNTKVLVSRVEDADVEVDACLARAFAPPIEAWKACSRLLNGQGHVLYYAGRSWNPDIQARLGQAGAATRICRVDEGAMQGPIVSMTRMSVEVSR